MTTIAILHPGQMGSAVGKALVDLGHDVVWRADRRSDETRARADAAALRAVDDLTDVEIVLSICPPAAAESTARSVEGFAGVYVDANAVSPATAGRVADIVTACGATYVDGGIIGGPPTEPGTRLYLSGDSAATVAATLDGPVLNAIVVGDDPYAASALKMTYAAWTKISAALLLATHDAAGQLGVRAALESEWAHSQPALAERLANAQRSAAAKGWRWVAEMQEIADTFDDVDRPSGFGDAAAEVYERYPKS